MSYLGSTPTTQSFIAGTDTFSGTGAQVAFTLSRSVNSVNDILVVVNNVDQQPTAYSASGTTLTFTAAPSSGTNNIYVRYLSTTLFSIAPSQGSVGTDQIQTNAITTEKIAAGAVVPADLSTGAPVWDTAGNLTVLGEKITSTCANTGIELGSNTVNTPYIDFHSSANSVDYDSRIIASGGTSSAGNGTLAVQSSLFQFNSGYGSAATAYGCRAWVNFNGTGTVAIRGSGNVTSITDNGVGAYTVNLTNSMPDINFSTNVTADGLSSGYIGTMFSTSITSSAVPIRAINQAGSAADSVTVNVSIFR